MQRPEVVNDRSANLLRGPAEPDHRSIVVREIERVLSGNPDVQVTVDRGFPVLVMPGIRLSGYRTRAVDGINLRVLARVSVPA